MSPFPAAAAEVFDLANIFTYVNFSYCGVN